ncbi:MAG: XrtA-associated tyrosine autokinase, partial [Kordiimonadaceae bacterium]|nr:XrtA-associated tyrosine autokinase [Kordiimonadaceae bacterium]
EKSKSSSLVERAAEKSGDSPFVGTGKGIGTPDPEKKRRDPSSMNPVAEAKPVGGIGTPGKTARREAGAVGGIGAPSAKRVKQNDSIEHEGRGIGATGAVNENDATADASADEQGEKTEVEPRGLAIGNVGATGTNKPAPRKKTKLEEVDLVGLREGGYITPDMAPNLLSEEFRIIKRTLLLNAFSKGKQRSENSNVILVTSSSPGEGKTFCAINLALSVATEQDTTVLLIDADFSKPEVLNRLGVAGGRGLMDVVADHELSLGDCLVRTSIPNLVLLPAGRQHNLTTELLASERMEHIVDEIANRYPDRLVIFDSPPVLASSAASVLALYMGQSVFVIQAEMTSESQIKESLNMISACENINLLLNQTRFSGTNMRFASYYGYGGR